MKQKLSLIVAVLGIIGVFTLFACKGDGSSTAPTIANAQTPPSATSVMPSLTSPTVEETQSPPEATEHTHVFGSWEAVVEADCTREGLLQRCCACGERETATVAMKEHSIRDGVCQFCGAVSDNGLVFTLNKDGYSFSGLGTYSGNELIIPSTFGGKPVTEIAANALCGCDHLTSIFIPDSVTAIGAYAFYGCSGLTELVIPSQVSAIGFCALGECSALERLSLPLTGDRFGALFSEFEELSSVPSSLKNLTLNAGTAIMDYAFQNCVSLETVTIGRECTVIGAGAFSGCSDLKQIHFLDCPKEIQADAFSGCTALCGVYITDIGRWCGIAFENSLSNPLYLGHNLYLDGELLTAVNIPDGVTAVGDHAFAGSALTELTVSDSVLTLGAHSFANCTSLTEVHLGQNVISLGRSTFSGCTKLEKIHVNSSLRSIGNSAFAYCNNLAEICFQGTASQWDAIEKGKFWQYEAGKFKLIYTQS